MLVAIRWGLEEFLTRNNGIHKDDRGTNKSYCYNNYDLCRVLWVSSQKGGVLVFLH